MLEGFTTEKRNESSMDIDTKSSIDILRIINAEDKKVPFAVEKALAPIANLVDDVVAAFRKGGRLVYIGAGTSGRLGVLDASECPPTFGVPRSMVQGLIAGGSEALTRSIEGAEDNQEDGVAALEGIGFGPDDVLVGITASGQAPYVLGAMARARDLGAVVAAISCNHGSRTFDYAKHAIFLDVGPEIVTGSTRMKAGTAQKLVLNMITTASMIRLGKVFHNLMVDLQPVNRKLVERSKRLIRQAAGCTKEEAEAAFEASGRRPKLAIIMVLLKVDKAEAERLEAAGGGPIAAAIRVHNEASQR
ncbi:MAG: N-acetylmuramic acid 6-phosphate etherase [Spirochaetae bacterium HGW-Spirochaetae-9]|nr:MAG: N-acetylmuramic acid 6-phosphate etherase [Spirochaetae bacterium HGW-Spirochaetae-9]